MKVNRKLVILGLILLTLCLIPMFPLELPDDQWEKSHFKAKQEEIEAAIETVRPSDKHFDSSRYTLKIHVGRIDIKESLFGMQIGSSGASIRSYFNVVPKGLSFLIYNYSEKTAQLVPDEYNHFLEWVAVEKHSKTMEKP